MTRKRLEQLIARSFDWITSALMFHKTPDHFNPFAAFAHECSLSQSFFQLQQRLNWKHLLWFVLTALKRLSSAAQHRRGGQGREVGRLDHLYLFTGVVDTNESSRTKSFPRESTLTEHKWRHVSIVVAKQCAALAWRFKTPRFWSWIITGELMWICAPPDSRY